jgi:hypothetical protein
MGECISPAIGKMNAAAAGINTTISIIKNPAKNEENRGFVNPRLNIVKPAFHKSSIPPFPFCIRIPLLSLDPKLSVEDFVNCAALPLQFY